MKTKSTLKNEFYNLIVHQHRLCVIINNCIIQIIGLIFHLTKVLLNIITLQVMQLVLFITFHSILLFLYSYTLHSYDSFLLNVSLYLLRSSCSSSLYIYSSYYFSFVFQLFNPLFSVIQCTYQYHFGYPFTFMAF